MAIAARDRTQLEALKQRLDVAVGVRVTDCHDQPPVDATGMKARVLIDTAGRFSLFGDGIADACVRSKTHSVDITGETVWVRSLIARYHGQAAPDGTRIIRCCGFDSVPSDLGAMLFARELQRRSGVPRRRAKAYWQIYGGFSDGTLASNINRRACGAVTLGRDPFLLDLADGHSRGEIERKRDPVGVQVERKVGTHPTWEEVSRQDRVLPIVPNGRSRVSRRGPEACTQAGWNGAGFVARERARWPVLYTRTAATTSVDASAGESSG